MPVSIDVLKDTHPCIQVDIGRSNAFMKMSQAFQHPTPSILSLSGKCVVDTQVHMVKFNFPSNSASVTVWKDGNHLHMCTKYTTTTASTESDIVSVGTVSLCGHVSGGGTGLLT